MALELIRFSIYRVDTREIVRTGYGMIHMANVEAQCAEGEDWILGWWEPGQIITEIDNEMRPVGLTPAAA